ncbi:MAG: putative 4-hydroxybenzoate polyprenyltransferase [Phycisphaerales bacterium]|nr:putative 4-hydroxybenzoate polyprenyltransferase [Phycisphaerales bacterium]
MAPVLTTLRLALGDIKLAHSVFAMPFALLATAMALPRELPAPRIATLFALIICCMFLARTWAMLINRIADAHFDRENPRTAQRAIAAGRLARRDATIVAAACALLFIAATLGFLVLLRNPWPAILSAPVLLWIAFYSFTKRFTASAHFFLGGALAVSPIAALIAINPQLLGLPLPITNPWTAPTPTGQAALWLAGFVLLWVAGFDIAYALQDRAFDRTRGLHSLPAKLSISASLWAARATHLAALACLVFALRTEPRFGALTTTAAALVTLTLICEHLVLHRRGLAGLPLAFFTLNGLISITLGALGLIDLWH